MLHPGLPVYDPCMTKFLGHASRALDLAAPASSVAEASIEQASPCLTGEVASSEQLLNLVVLAIQDPMKRLLKVAQRELFFRPKTVVTSHPIGTYGRISKRGALGCFQACDIEITCSIYFHGLPFEMQTCAMALGPVKYRFAQHRCPC